MNGTADAHGLVVHVRKVDAEASLSTLHYSGREGQIACSVQNKVYIFGGVEQGQGNEPKESKAFF